MAGWLAVRSSGLRASNLVMMTLIASLALAGVLAAGTPSPAAKWRAILEPVGDSRVRGGATAEAKGESTHFIITVRGGIAGSPLAWHMRAGTCAAPGGIIGSGYPELQVGPGGTAQAAITLPVPPPNEGSHIIQVHGPGGGVVSCGELKPIG